MVEISWHTANCHKMSLKSQEIKYKNICIAGEFGTGSSTLMHNLATKLGWDFLSAGDFIRAWHKENDVPVEHSDKIPAKVDRALDASFLKKMSVSEQMI